MRCGCPECGAYMVQSESLDLGCVCPDCLYRCRACMGTDTVVPREMLKTLVFTGATPPEDENEDGEPPGPSGPPTPLDWID